LETASRLAGHDLTFGLIGKPPHAAFGNHPPGRPRQKRAADVTGQAARKTPGWDSPQLGLEPEGKRA
jgi:hypothetical protein